MKCPFPQTYSLQARTALKLSGFRILQRSVRICASAALVMEGVKGEWMLPEAGVSLHIHRYSRLKFKFEIGVSKGRFRFITIPLLIENYRL